MDLDKSNYFSEQILEAIKLVTQKQIDNLSFDKTILCTVTEVKDASLGHYVVSYSGADSSNNYTSIYKSASHFDAYSSSEEKYEVGDNVYVIVPQSDFTQQKTIVRKKIKDTTPPINYIKPTEKIIKIVSINGLEQKNENDNTSWSLLANNPEETEKRLFSWFAESQSGETAEINPVTANKLAISASFRSLLNGLDVYDGIYGLRIKLIGLTTGWKNDLVSIKKQEELKEIENASVRLSNGDLTDEEFQQQVEDIHTEYANQIKLLLEEEKAEALNHIVVQNYTFTNKEMFGNIYEFLTDTLQEKLIDLQDFPYPIYGLEVYFFQSNNGCGQNIPFISTDGKQIKHSVTYKGLNESINLPDNLFVDNINLYFGDSLENEQEGNLHLYTQDSIAYSAADKGNIKRLKLRWILNKRPNSNTPILMSVDQWDENAKDETEGNLKLTPDFWKNKTIYLYKWTQNQDEPDNYAGPFWEQVAAWHDFNFDNSVSKIRLVETVGNSNNVYQYVDETFNGIPLDTTGAVTDPYDAYQIGSETEENRFRVSIKEGEGISAFDDPFNFEIQITKTDTQNAFIRYKIIIVEHNLIENTGTYVTGDECNIYNSTFEGAEEGTEEGAEVKIYKGKKYYTFDENVFYRSEEITFNNKDETISQAEMSLIQGLELTCTDGSNGIYRIYGENNKIFGQSNFASMNLRVNFKAVEIEGFETGPTKIKWYYPARNTMFVRPREGKSTVYYYEEDKDATIASFEEENPYYIYQPSVTTNGGYLELKHQTKDDPTSPIGYSIDGQFYYYSTTQKLYQKKTKDVGWEEDDENEDWLVYEQDLDISSYGGKNDVEDCENQIAYYISPFYSSIWTNNTIRCEITRYGRTYSVEKEFSFGHYSTNGTNYAFDISLEREYNYDETTIIGDPSSLSIVPFLRKNNPNLVKVKATLINGKEEITDLSRVKWSWEVISKSVNNDPQNNEPQNNEPHILMYNLNGQKISEGGTASGAYIYLQENTGNTEDLSNYYAILKAEINKDSININEQGESSPDKTRKVLLTAYLPIGISASDDITAYIGGTSIIYSDYGSDPVYYEGEHKLERESESEENFQNALSWEFKNSDGENNSNNANNYYPLMYRSDDLKWYIRPTSMYFSGINNTGRIIVKDADSQDILYVQPIFIAQNAWGNQTINQWDGALKIDKNNNYILSSMIGAGKKNSDNTFSGVLLGQVGTDFNAPTGIYGYREGAQTYGFRDNGTAFIGASGSGRIEFDGTNATITSGNYDIGKGMQIDLDDGKINAYNFTLTAGSNNEQIIITSNNNKTEGKYDKNPLTIGSKFSVAWDGTVTMFGAKIGGNWSGTGYAQSDSSTIESILQALATSAKEADDATNALVNTHWEPDNLYNQMIQWPDQQFIEEKNVDGEQLYWDIGGRITVFTQTAANDYPCIINNVQETNTDGEKLYVKPNSPTTTSSKRTVSSWISEVSYDNPMVIRINPAYTHFVVTNRTYGGGNHEYILEKDGSMLAKNGIFSGVISAYAGDLGGWALTPGILSYGYNMKYTQSNDGNYWTGEFFTDSDYHQSADIGEEPFTTGSNGNTASSVSVGTKKAFIYLRNNGTGITINNFGYENANQTGESLNNIIFSLGENFAVNQHGDIFAHNGTFSGTINATSGTIGGWSISQNGIKYQTKNSNNVVDKEITLDKSSGLDFKTLINEELKSQFTVDLSGALKAISGTIGGLTLYDGYLSSAVKGTTTDSIDYGNIMIYPGQNSSSVAFKIGSRFKVLADGSIEANNGTFTGTIRASQFQSTPSYKQKFGTSYKFIGSSSYDGEDKYYGTWGITINNKEAASGFWKDALFTKMVSYHGNSSLITLDDSSKVTLRSGYGYAWPPHLGLTQPTDSSSMKQYGYDHSTYLGFLRGAGPTSYHPWNVFFGLKSSKYIVIENKVYDPDDGNLVSKPNSNLTNANSSWIWDPPSNNATDDEVTTTYSRYNAWIKFNGNAKFRSLTITGDNDFHGGDDFDYYKTYVWGIDHNGDASFNHIISHIDKTKYIGLTWNGNQQKTDTNPDYFWKNSLYTMRRGQLTIPSHAKYNDDGTTSTASATTTDKYRYVAFIRGFGEDSASNTMTFIGARRSKDENTDNLSKNIDTTWIDWWSNPNNSEYTFRIGVDGGAEFKSLKVNGQSLPGGSDIRLKTELKLIKNLDLYDHLIPYSFRWKETNLKTYGFIAQEIEDLSKKYQNDSDDLFYSIKTIHPNYIDTETEYCINYNNFHALHVAKNHQQDKRIAQLEQQVSELQNQIEQLLRDKGGN